MILYPDGKVEGTPEEIAQWKEKQDQRRENEFIKRMKEVGSGQTTISKCPNAGSPCFCTGACMGMNNFVETRSYT